MAELIRSWPSPPVWNTSKRVSSPGFESQESAASRSYFVTTYTVYPLNEEKNGQPQRMATSSQLSPVWKSLENPYRALPLWISLKMARIINAWEGLPTVGHCHPSGWPAACGPGLEPQVTGVPKSWGYPNSWVWFITENPKAKWMITAGTPTYGWFIHLYHGKSYENPWLGGYPHDLRNRHSWMIHSSVSRTVPPFLLPRQRHLARWPTFGGRSGCQTLP